MKKHLLTAVNVGAILAIFIVLLQEPNGVFMALVFLALIICALAGWWFFGRKTRQN